MFLKDHADRVREAMRSDTLGDRLQVEFYSTCFFKCTFHMLSCRLIVGMLVSSGHQLEPYLYISLPDTGDRRHARIKFDDEVLSGRVCFSMVYYTYRLRGCLHVVINLPPPNRMF